LLEYKYLLNRVNVISYNKLTLILLERWLLINSIIILVSIVKKYKAKSSKKNKDHVVFM